MAETKKYAGGCHCGRFTFEVNTDLDTAISCNCSICTKRGLVLTMVGPEQFALTKGTLGEMTKYQFNKKVVDHLFCPDCGVEAFGTGQAPNGQTMFAINVRCLEGVDVTTLKPRPVDGRKY
ncbi:GFA family protein [Archangium primigenium]|uniref:GFA family protein n=1 Tax=[Archangium] primigenium TaxID=2792470 RepID=UPI001958E5DA|nr:GFA family protein [Archangium primigenium]MBM7117898.1 GFA family protein [Archangium primigenium]